MRDAFGGAFMIKLFLVFIFVYICFTAMALNYAKAFKVKNEVIAYLEDNEIADLGDINASEMEAMNEFFQRELIGKRGYNISQYSKCESIEFSCNEEGTVCTYCHPSGIEIEQQKNAANTEGIYYTVSTYISWGVPFLNNILNGNPSEGAASGLWKVSGETRMIYEKDR